MGINIIAYKILDKVVDESGFMKSSYWNVERHNEFDSLRYSGDRDFINSDYVEWEELVDDTVYDSRDYIRPENINNAKQWVKENIYPGNQPRLLKLLEDMEKDPKLYIFVSW